MSPFKTFLFLTALLYSSATFAMYEEGSKEDQDRKGPSQQLSKDAVESTEGKSLGSRYSKAQIQQNPPLWLHIRAEKRSLYSAYANAWVTLGSDENARRYAVSGLYLSLDFETKTEDTQTDSPSIEVSQRTSNKCYSQVFATARTTGPNGSVSVATN